MKNLFNLQNHFQNYLVNEKNDFKEWILSTEKVSKETRLEIYHYAYQSRLRECLETNYPVLSAYVGSDAFEKMALAYTSLHPSEFRSIRWFGDRLPEFLLQDPLYREYPHIVELAQFEWLMTLVFDAGDSQILQMEQVAKIPPESWGHMQLQMHPSVNRMNLSWNTIEIWEAVSHDKTPPEPVHYPSSSPWILWRKELLCRFHSLEPAEAWAIDAILKKATFGEICEGLSQWMDEEKVGVHAASLLKGWIVAGLLAKEVSSVNEPKPVFLVSL